MDTLKDKFFYILWIASILGSVAVLPYVSTQVSIVLTPIMIASMLIQAALIYGFVVFFGIRISKKLDFKISPTKKYFVLSIVSGLGVGLALKLLDKFVFAINTNMLLKHDINIAPWQGILASIYGAVNEEILLRLFAVSLIVLLLKKILKFSKSSCVIISIVFCTLLFALGHLPMLYKIVEAPNVWDVTRVMTLNSLAGVVFGFLYWRYGLFSSMLCHFIADLVIHVFWRF